MSVEEKKYKREEHIGKELIQSVDFEKRVITIRMAQKPKLISGTKISTILGRNQYSTPFAEACSMFRLYWVSEENRFTEFGKINEPKIRSWARASLKKNDLGFGGQMGVEDPVPAEDCYYDHFGYRLRPFGGLVDGYVTKDGDRCAVLEIKTASSRAGWEDESGNITRVPENYVEQASFYCALTGLKKIVFVVGFTKETDYDYPESWQPTDDNTFIVVVDPKDVSEDMQQSKEWAEKITVTKQLPPWTDSDCDQRILGRLFTKELTASAFSRKDLVEKYIQTGDDKVLEEIKGILAGKTTFENKVIYKHNGHIFVATKVNGSWSMEVTKQ